MCLLISSVLSTIPLLLTKFLIYIINNGWLMMKAVIIELQALLMNPFTRDSWQLEQQF